MTSTRSHNREEQEEKTHRPHAKPKRLNELPKLPLSLEFTPSDHLAPLRKPRSSGTVKDEDDVERYAEEGGELVEEDKEVLVGVRRLADGEGLDLAREEGEREE